MYIRRAIIGVVDGTGDTGEKYYCEVQPYSRDLFAFMWQCGMCKTAFSTVGASSICFCSRRSVSCLPFSHRSVDAFFIRLDYAVRT